MGAVGAVLLLIAGVLGLFTVAESGYRPATGVLVSAEVVKRNYHLIVDVSRDGASTRVHLSVPILAYDHFPMPGERMALLQSPTDPQRVSFVHYSERLGPMATFFASGVLLMWLAFGAKLPRPKATRERPSNMAYPVVVDHSKLRPKVPHTPGVQRVFGRR